MLNIHYLTLSLCSMIGVGNYQVGVVTLEKLLELVQTISQSEYQSGNFNHPMWPEAPFSHVKLIFYF